MESRLTLSRTPQTRNSLPSGPRFEIRVIKKPVRGAGEPFPSESLMDSLVLIIFHK